MFVGIHANPKSSGLLTNGCMFDMMAQIHRSCGLSDCMHHSLLYNVLGRARCWCVAVTEVVNMDMGIHRCMTKLHTDLIFTHRGGGCGCLLTSCGCLGAIMAGRRNQKNWTQRSVVATFYANLCGSCWTNVMHLIWGVGLQWNGNIGTNSCLLAEESSTRSGWGLPGTALAQDAWVLCNLLTTWALLCCCQPDLTAQHALQIWTSWYLQACVHTYKTHRYY